tara:strand:- start:551 stop:829 length:279 start_codon:yes stop_codon:yes gene_type:complete
MTLRAVCVTNHVLRHPVVLANQITKPGYAVLAKRREPVFRAPLKKVLPKALLQFTHRHGKCWLRSVQSSGSAVKAAFFNNRDDVSQLLDFQV